MGGKTKNGNLTRMGNDDIDRMIARWEREPKPVGLPHYVVEQLGQRHEGDGTRVSALVPLEYHYREMKPFDAEVIAWTKTAVKIRFTLIPGTNPVEMWVWANQVKRIKQAENSGRQSFLPGGEMK